MDSTIVVIKGAGDIGSAVAHRFKGAKWAPVLVESAANVVLRRLMSLSGVLHGDASELEGLRGVLCLDLAALWDCLHRPDCLPVMEEKAWNAYAERPPPRVVVDARMRKKQQASPQMDEAPLVIGIGPGFSAGDQVHAVVESNWGDALGRVLWQGPPQDYTGEPRKVEGQGTERFLYASHGGTFRTSHDILAPVQAGEVVGRVEDTLMKVSIGGILRGLAYDGTLVAQGAKLVEVDPRGDPDSCRGIAERPARIAEGVLEAVNSLFPHPGGE